MRQKISQSIRETLMAKTKMNKAETDSTQIDYTRKVTMPIRDMYDDSIAFCVDVYGVTPSDLCIVPGGSAPMRKAVDRLGLDPLRYRALIWDVPVKGNNR
jgi:hypothetical protein